MRKDPVAILQGRRLNLKNNEMNVTILEIYETEDKNCYLDELYKYMFLDGKIILSGDYYHNKISSQITGAIGMLHALNKPFTYEKIRIADSALYYTTPKEELLKAAKEHPDKEHTIIEKK